MARTGFKRNFKPLNLLTEEQVGQIHRSSLRVLEETGHRIEHDKALNLLKSNGCKVDSEAQRVRFPPWLVEECLRKCPASFRVKARNPNNDIIIGGDTLYFSTTPGMHTIDLETWEPRPPTKKEFHDALIVVDALENPQMTSNYYPWFGWEGLPPVMCVPEGFAATLRNTSKPVSTAYSNDCEIFTIAMAQAVGSEAFVAPLPSPPLTFYREAIEALYRGLAVNFPVRFVSGLVMGATSPATIAGSVVSFNASALAGIVLAQLIKPGARVAVSPHGFPQNMRSGLCSFGNIGECLLRAASNQYWRRQRVPILNICGYTDSKRIDAQSAYERGFQAITSALTGANVVAMGGALHGELTLHPVQIVIDDDIANMIGRYVEGIEVSEETLAIDLINEVGPIPGMFLDKEHTRKWWKKEQYMPKTADRLSLPEWKQEGKKSMIDYAQERIAEILSTYKPLPFTPKQDEDVTGILKDAWEFYKKKGML